MNIISETKLDNYKFSTDINGKTYYFKNDNSSKEKIFLGLCVDTDLLLNNNNFKNLIFDTYTISGLLQENSHLYQGTNLGYDPYKEANIDNKGKSYLKLCYNNVGNPDLDSLRTEQIQYNNNRKINSYIDGFNHHKTGLYIVEIIGCVFLIIIVIISLFNKMNCFLSGIAVIALILFFIPVIKAFKNIKRLNKLADIDARYDYSGTKTINILYIIFNLVLFVSILVGMFILAEKDRIYD